MVINKCILKPVDFLSIWLRVQVNENSLSNNQPQQLKVGQPSSQGQSTSKLFLPHTGIESTAHLKSHVETVEKPAELVTVQQSGHEEIPPQDEITLLQISYAEIPTHNEIRDQYVSQVELPAENEKTEAVKQSNLAPLPLNEKDAGTAQQSMVTTSDPGNGFFEMVEQSSVDTHDQEGKKVLVWYQEDPSESQNKQVNSSLLELQKNRQLNSRHYCGVNPEEPFSNKFTEKEEKNVVDYIAHLYNLGYGFTRLDMAMIATEYAVYLRKRIRTQPIVMNWIGDMIRKYPQLQVISKKCKLTLTGILTNYFDHLESIMAKYSFGTTPELVFSVFDIEIKQDDSDNGTEKILSTVVACANAAGQPFPPFFVFPGQEMTTDLMNRALPGSTAVVTQDGLLNAEVFIEFLNGHLLKNISEDNYGKPILVHVNGAKFSSVGLTELARKHNVTLIFPPSELTNALIPLDAGCIESFQMEFMRECEEYIQTKKMNVTMNSVCEIVCKIYEKALTSNNTTEGFRKAGLFPCNRHMIILKGKS